MLHTRTAEELQAMEQEHDAQITALRAQLTNQLHDATTAVTNALKTIGRLTSDEIYDIEFVEGTTDTADFLTDAARMLRAAAAFNPTT